MKGAMNNTEETMYGSKAGVDLIAYTVALEAAAETLALVKKVPAPFRSLADQVIRAASSVPANLAEGHGRFGRDRMNHWRIAYGSAKEVDAFVRLLATSGSIEAERAAAALELFDRVRALTWKLIHARR
jgi:four helix bundle protein